MCDECRDMWGDTLGDVSLVVARLRTQVTVLEGKLAETIKRRRQTPRVIAPEYVGECVQCYPHWVHKGGKCFSCDCDVSWRARTSRRVSTGPRRERSHE